MRFFMAFGLLALIIHCGCLPSWPAEESSLTAALLRVKKEADAIGQLEECALVDSWQEQPGFINVLAFLDASWEYSHRQAAMLKMLHGRLERSGITGIKFFVINSAKPEAAVNKVDVEDEEEAWGAAQSANDQAILEIEKTREELKKKIDPDIAFIQDTEDLKIWEKLSSSRDQVVVIDKCGRLSYRVIVPWSILHFPYVKAAILSTYKEQPCGACDLETTTVAQNTESQTEPLPESVLEDLNIERMQEIAHLQEIVLKKYNLDKTDNTVKKKMYHGTEPQEIPDSVIKLLNGSAAVKQQEATADFSNSTKHGPLMSTGDSNFDDSYVNRYSQAPNLTDDNIGDNKHEDLLIIEDTPNINESMEAENDSNSYSSTIINESAESVESKTVQSLEDQSSNDSEQRYYLGDYHEADNIGSAEPASVNNTSNDFEKENSDSDSYSVESSESGNGYIDNNTSDLEVSNTSVSISSEQSGNHINKMAPASGESNAYDRSESLDYAMPIRIIMHAPHIHKSEEPTKKYEYLVLKIGSPEYHGHLEDDNDDDFVLKDKETSFENAYDSSNETEGVTGKQNVEAELGSEEVGRNGKKHGDHGNHHGHESHKHSSGKHLDLVFDKDESPGFYGEDVEYWRNFGNGDDTERVQIELPESEAENGKDNRKLVEGYDAVNITETNQNNSTITEATKNDTIIDESTPRYHNSETNSETAKIPEETVQEKEFEDSAKDDEIANQLFIHYSKLIPWLNYVIDE